METRFKLKLLNGPLAGRELRLPEGLFSIGGEDGDVSLTLEGGGQAVLEVGAEQVALASVSLCWVAGRRTLPGPLPLQQPIDLAGVHFVLGTAEEALASPRMPSRSRHGHWAAGTLLTLVLAGGVSWAMSPAAPAPAPSPRDWLPQALRAEPTLQARWLDQDTLELSGRCQNGTALLPLTARLRASGVRLHQDTVCNDDLQRSVHAVLASFTYPEAEVAVSGAGHAEIDAPVQGNAAALGAALDHLTGLASWRLKDRGAEEFSELLQRLSADGLLAGLSLSRTEQGWMLTGRLSSSSETDLAALLERWNAEKGRLPLRYLSADNQTDAKDYLPAAMAGVGGNAKSPYLALANGMRLQLGSPLHNGWRVAAISAEGVSLANSRQLLFLSLHE